MGGLFESLLVLVASDACDRFDARSFRRFITSMLLIRAGASPLLRTSILLLYCRSIYGIACSACGRCDRPWPHGGRLMVYRVCLLLASGGKGLATVELVPNEVFFR